MRIILIDKEEGLKVGGVVTYSQRLSQYLKSHGHQVYILRFSRERPKQKDIFAIPYYLAEKRSFIFVPSEKTLGIIKKHLIDLQPDIVYTTNGLSPLDFFLPSLCHELNIPLVGVWHADFSHNRSSYQLLAKSLFLAYLPFCRQLDLLHVFSAKLASFYSDKGIPRKKILALPNGVDPKIYSPGNSSFKERHKIHTGILFLGRLTIQKNPEVLIKSFLSIDPPAGTKLVIVGYGEKESELRETYKDPRIIFTGAVLREKRKIDIIRACQVFVLPSRFEGMPLALLETMSSCLACIASDAGSNKELLEKVGIVIPTTHLRFELPVILRLLLENPEFAEILGKKARQKVISTYSQKIIFDKLLAAFKKTIFDYRKRGPPITKPTDLNKEIMKRLNVILKKLENLVRMDQVFQ